ncbi:inorganic phosphate transporter [Hydrogenimonas cancrithermarum]|uniref:Phosphate transporter n=1 Tax=Hydrogenimonas cancrithermarum TaxID=2993563 RepID=A0ABN6WXL9_9BACT|nr:inorganic phosphate transporter [Hydrogenimonas cancrithermarum]BDY13798.1 putative phosphate permease [Hydrogenimonas cancrithermarum]
MEINTFEKMQKKAAKKSQTDFLRLGLSLVFMAIVLLATWDKIPGNPFLAVAAVFGAYMAMNIGANDVANNVGPAVGSKALTMVGAILIAAVFESAGALIAGADVTGTIKKGIIDPAAFTHPEYFVWAMTAALLAAALWLNLATYLKAPVSTTHSIVGGVMGGGIAAAGTFSIVAWGTMGKIAASWVISPILGGVIAAGFLYAIKKTIIYKDDTKEAAMKMVPLYVAVMGWAFITYVILKGIKHIIKLGFPTAAGIGLVGAVVIFVLVKSAIVRHAHKLNNERSSVNRLFTIPLIFAAALLSFAHGANDVANAVGPLAGIYDALTHATISTKAAIPLWVMVIGAIGISLGLALYGPKLIKTVGSEITELDQIRAFSIALAAAITVIIASQLGLPVSSTHIALGGVFGVGFLREWLDRTQRLEYRIKEEKEKLEELKRRLDAFKTELTTLEAKTVKTQQDYERIVHLFELIGMHEKEIKKENKALKTVYKTKYVQRNALKKIVAAWVVTVPAAAVLSAIIFFVIKGIMV